MLDWLDQHGIEALIAGLLTVIAFGFRRFAAAQDKNTADIAELQKNRVTRDDFDELRSSLMATATQNHNRLEERLDRIWQHLSGGAR